jgi:hypothetical protein
MYIGKELPAVKLKKLMESEGYSELDDLLSAVVGDSVSPAICIEPTCNFSTEMEPDQTRGYRGPCLARTIIPTN